MTNFEFYKDKILEIGTVDDIALTDDGELHNCSHMSFCSDCEFDKGDCEIVKTKWLYMEHVEKPKPPKLTKKERTFCELFEKGYLARDNDGDDLYLFKNKPHKREYFWDVDGYDFINLYEFKDIATLKFDFIKWEDEEPWSVEELLKLEVEE